MTVQGINIARYANGNDDRTAGYMPVFGQKKPPAGASFKDMAAAKAAPAESAPPSAPASAPVEHSAFYNFFKGVFDIINPLQHIPVVGALYRHITGDEPAPMARLAGDTLYGGPLGAAVGFADIALKKATGRDIGETAFAMLDTGKPATDTLLAQNEIPRNSRPSPDPTAIAWDEPVSYTAPRLVTPVPAPKDNDTTRMAASSPLRQQDAPGSADIASASPGPIWAPTNNKTAEPSGPIWALANKEAQPRYFTTEKASEKSAALSQKMIAAKMMEALDKYGAMKKTGLAPQAPLVSGAY